MLENIFGRTTTVKIVEAFLKKENRSRWMNLREVSRHSQTNPGTVSRNIHVLVENEILVEERPSEWSRIFKLNTDNKYVLLMIEFYEKLLETRPTHLRNP
ncbi:hypothetical protein AKJ44_01520 [candidate division MSBL1 archaeon SCGC-AAA261F17]|uniref:HTH iclR-type domain-containing protein n=1 Tax=candidate division MSBL1 archaeon SCGC-AAA261F17 TaxID=1698274 RepID=A0A133V6L3_9EURY|nr:hypothetical protein AKJ44_01520 [candidate division MSBL1 archaeon SCGC-AAA261F17]